MRIWWSFLSGYICVWVFVLDFFALYCPIGRDPFYVRVGIDLCTIGACFCHQRKLIRIPMSLWWLDILSISHSIGILFLFFDVWGWFLLYILLLLQVVWVVVWGSCFHIFHFWYRVVTRWHGTHCESSMLSEFLINKSQVLGLLQFQMVLLILEQSFYDDSSSDFSCRARPSGSFQMGWSSIVFYWLFLFLPIHGWPMLLPFIDHSFHLLLDWRVLGMGECDWDGDWTITLY